MKRLLFAVLALSGLAFCGALVFVVLQPAFLNRAQDVPPDASEDVSRDTSHDSNWNSYSHDALGISFSYRKEWGEPFTQPSEHITDLARFKKEMKESSIDDYRHTINVRFSKHRDFTDSGPLVRATDDEYDGDLYPNAGAYRFGSTENLRTVADTGDICTYTVAFDQREKFENTLDIPWSECSNGVKTLIIRHTEVFKSGEGLPPELAGTRYSYTVRHIAYAPLRNAVYPHAFIQRDSVRVLQLRTAETIGLSDILKHENISPEEYASITSDFGKFAKSFQTFEPTPKEPPPLIDIPGQHSNRRVISEFFHALASGNLDKGYALVAPGSISRTEFAKRYTDLYALIVHSITDARGGTHSVLITSQMHNMPPEEYRITISVDSGKMRIHGSEKIIERKAHVPYEALVKLRNDEVLVVLEKNAEEVIIERALAQPKEEVGIVQFRDLEFSPNGSYLTYVRLGWEWADARIYDISRKKLHELDGYAHMQFAPDEAILAACTDRGMATERSGDIYRLPEFKKIFDLTKRHPDHEPYQEFSCELDAKQGIVRYELKGLLDEKTGVVDESAQKVIHYVIASGETRLISEKQD